MGYKQQFQWHGKKNKISPRNSSLSPGTSSKCNAFMYPIPAQGDIFALENSRGPEMWNKQIHSDFIERSNGGKKKRKNFSRTGSDKNSHRASAREQAGQENSWDASSSLPASFQAAVRSGPSPGDRSGTRAAGRRAHTLPGCRQAASVPAFSCNRCALGQRRGRKDGMVAKKEKKREKKGKKL